MFCWGFVLLRGGGGAGCEGSTFTRFSACACGRTATVSGLLVFSLGRSNPAIKGIEQHII